MSAKPQTLLEKATAALFQATSGPIEFASPNGVEAARSEARAVLLCAGFPAQALEQPPGGWIVVPVHG